MTILQSSYIPRSVRPLLVLFVLLSVVACRSGETELPPVARPSSLLDDPSAAVSAWRQALGSQRRVDEIRIYAQSASLRVQDPEVPANVDEYGFAWGVVLGPRPVTPIGGAHCQIPFDSIDFTVLPAMVKDARSRVTVRDVEQMFLRLAPCTSARWSFLAEGPRGTDTFTYDLAGKRVEMGAPEPSRGDERLTAVCEGYLAAQRACWEREVLRSHAASRRALREAHELAERSLREAFRALPARDVDGVCRAELSRVQSSPGCLESAQPAAPPSSSSPPGGAADSASSAGAAAARADDPKAEAYRMLNMGRSNDVIPFAKAAIAKNPRDPMPYVYLAVAYETLGRLDEKRTAYDDCATNADHRDPNYGNCTQFGGHDRAEP